MISRLQERVLRNRYGFVAAIGGALLLMALNEAVYRHSHQRLVAGIALTDARIQAAQTLQWLTDAETAVRGHVLTGDRLQLVPYQQALAQLPTVRSQRPVTAHASRPRCSRLANSATRQRASMRRRQRSYLRTGSRPLHPEWRGRCIRVE